MDDTKTQFEKALAICRDLFVKKLKDYGASWRVMRPSSLADQIFIKAKRIRTLETTGVAMVDEDIRGELIGIINYGLIVLIQLDKGYADVVDMTNDEALKLYDSFSHETLELMLRKNHDYNEAWRDMRPSSYTDFILTKINRAKEIESHNGRTLVSEGVESNYMDIINYAVFGLIKIEFGG